MKIIAAALFAALTLSTCVPFAQAAKEKKPYTVAAFLEDAFLIGAGSSILGVAAFSALTAHKAKSDIQDLKRSSRNFLGALTRSTAEERRIQDQTNETGYTMLKSLGLSYVAGAIGFGMVQRGISNMLKRR